LTVTLYQNALSGINGIFHEGNPYKINEEEAEEFESGFSKKEKCFAKTQDRFNELVNKYL
jgi:hypothetical protein